MKYKILIVDDEPANLRLLERLFRREFQVVSAESGQQALELLKQHDIALIITDQRMPGMTGVEFLKLASEMRRQTVRVILTGYTDIAALVDAINSGIVYKYVTKPWINEDLKQTVIRALDHYETIKNQHELKQHYDRLSEHLKISKESFINLITEILDTKDQYAAGHALRTKEHAIAIGHQFNLDDKEIEQLSIAAQLHEIEKLAIPDKILQKAEPLTEEEQRIVESSTEQAAGILESIPDMTEAASVIRYQHEHYDGSRPPEHLRGEQIPLYARIISVASAFDSMTNHHLPEKSLTDEEALEQLKMNAGKKFDPAVVERFCELKSNGKKERPG